MPQGKRRMAEPQGIWRARLRAQKAAQRLIERYAIEAPEHILLRAIAHAEHISVVEAPLRGATARLAHSGRSGRIRVSSAIQNEGRKRFSIAHELGHFFLKHPGINLLICQEEGMHDFSGHERFETEANLFAAELLLPEQLIRSRCEVSPVNLQPVLQLAADFRTSITSTAIRFVQLSPEQCAVAYSVNGVVKWWIKNDALLGWLRHRGTKLDRSSLAYGYFHKGTLPENAHPVSPDAWLEADSAERFEEIMEHSLAIPSVGAVLTLLWIEENVPMDDDDSDEADVEWSPFDARQRKRWPK